MGCGNGPITAVGKATEYHPSVFLVSFQFSLTTTTSVKVETHHMGRILHQQQLQTNKQTDRAEHHTNADRSRK